MLRAAGDRGDPGRIVAAGSNRGRTSHWLDRGERFFGDEIRFQIGQSQTSEAMVTFCGPRPAIPDVSLETASRRTTGKGGRSFKGTGDRSRSSATTSS
jgi:hypothetical protein